LRPSCRGNTTWAKVLYLASQEDARTA